MDKLKDLLSGRLLRPGEDEGARIREAYGENHDRLVELKKLWDPENRLQHNQNIRPH